MSIASLMNAGCTIEQSNTSKGAAGFNVRAWSQVGSSIPCRVERLSAEAIAYYSRNGVQATEKFYFAIDPVLKGYEATRRIVFEGEAYYPHNVDNAGGGIGRLWQVLCVKKPLQYATTGQ